VITFAGLGWFYLAALPGWLPLGIARSVLIFLGIPLLAGYLTRHLGEHTDHQPAAERRPHRPPPPGLLRDHVGRIVRPRPVVNDGMFRPPA